MNIDEAKQQLAPVVDALLITPRRNAVREWNGFETTDPGRASAISTTTRAGMIHDFTVIEVRRALLTDSVKSIAREVNSFDFFAIAVGSGLIVRYKYVAGGLPQNVSTEAQRRLAMQQYDDQTMGELTFEGIQEPPTLVTCGYTLDVDGGLGTISVQCDFAKTVLWKHVVWGDSGAGFGSFETLPLDPSLAPEATIVRSATEERRPTDVSSEE